MPFDLDCQKIDQEQERGNFVDRLRLNHEKEFRNGKKVQFSFHIASRSTFSTALSINEWYSAW